MQLSAGDPLAAVCGRGDLYGSAPSLHGCFDTKVTSVSHALLREAYTVNGPTTEVRML